MTKHVHMTWYLLADGTQADPNDVAPDDKGVLRHKNGVAVGMRENGVPMTIGHVTEENKTANEAAQRPARDAAAAAGEPLAPAKADAPAPAETDDPTATPAKQAKPKADREMKAGKGKAYKTR